MKPVTLEIMEALYARMNLDHEEKRYLGHLQKGFQGECQLIESFNGMSCPHILLTNVTFQPKNAGHIQLDALLLIKEATIIYEVKNYSGDWIYGPEYFSKGEIEIPNPKIQALRTKNNFKQLLRELGYGGITVEACVVFVNAEFTLYEVSPDKNVIFAAQIADHIQRLEKFPRPYAAEFDRLAATLRAAALPEEPFQRHMPTYDFHTLRKGIRCGVCGELAQAKTQRKHSCDACGAEGLNSDGLLRAIDEFRLLFPNQHLSGRILSEWCGGMLSSSRCRKILQSMRTQRCE